MNKSYSRWFLAPLALLVLISFATPPVFAAAARGGGGARAGQNVQPNNSRADVRTNNVRSTSVNNVNVNVDQRHDGWDHPVAAAVIIGGAIAGAVGSTVYTVPPNCVPVDYGGVIYQQCGGTWYVQQGSQFVVVNPPY